MKLVKLFANRNFKNVEFNDGFNVVLASTSENEANKDTHGLGKTSLIHVINFVLLGSFNKKIFENGIFQGVVFYGELALNSGEFLMVRREIDTNSKVSFKKNKSKVRGFEPPTTWDQENLPFDKAKAALNDYLDFNVVTSFPYRKSITYFLRTQQDYLDVFRLNKFKGKHADWKPFVFELLGYSSDLLSKKLSLEEDISSKKSRIKILKEDAEINIEERDKLAGLQDIKKQEIDEAKQTIDKFNFFLQDEEINQSLIEKIDSQIQTLSTERYRLSYEISKIQKALENINETINLEDLAQLHKEAKLILPEELKKDFSELIEFNKAISKDRKKYLTENLQNLQQELSGIQNELKVYEADKSDKLSFLTEKDSYAKFKEYQKRLSKLEAEEERLQDKIKAVDQSIEIEIQINEIEEQVKSLVIEIRQAINKRHHAEINRIFNNIIYEVLGTNALLSISQNKQGNVEFSADYQNPEDLNTTSEAQGTTYQKLLCMAFDLSLLTYYSKSSFFRFVYHDGILEGLDDRIKIRLIKKVKQLCSENDLQYIISLIDSDTPVEEGGDKFIFSNSEICLNLHDRDDSGKIFLHSF